MTASYPAALIKFFSEERFADDFIKGHLYMRRLGYFQDLERGEIDDGRADPHEAVVSWHQPDRVEMEINFLGLAPIKLGKADFAGPVSVTRMFYADLHLFCMSALMILDPAYLEGGAEEVQAQLQKAAQIDARCLEFGPYAVVVPYGKFLTRLRESLATRIHWSKYGIVKYYDDATFHGDFEIEEAPFMKQKKFAYQNEFRICLQTPPGDEAIVFDIGDISSFAIKMPSADINGNLKITINPKEPGRLGLTGNAGD